MLEPGTVRRVCAIERAVETLEGAVDGLEVWMEFGREPGPDRAGHYQRAVGGRKGPHRRGWVAGGDQREGRHVVAVYSRHRRSGRQAFSIGLKDLEPVDRPTEGETATEETVAVSEAGETTEASVGMG